MGTLLLMYVFVLEGEGAGVRHTVHSMLALFERNIVGLLLLPLAVLLRLSTFMSSGLLLPICFLRF